MEEFFNNSNKFLRGKEHGVLMRAGLYARVYTHDQQTLPIQLLEMKKYIAYSGWSLFILERSNK